jgi:hypothetical protein
MLTDTNAQRRYIEENYPEVTDRRIDDDHWDLECSQCKVTRGFQVIRREVQTFHTQYATQEDFSAPITYYFRCPVCKAYKMWILFSIAFSKKRKMAPKFDSLGTLELRQFRARVLMR